MKTILMRFFLLAGITFLVLSCAPTATTESKPVVPAVPGQPAPAPATQKSEWDKIVEEAKKEGRVVIYTSAGSSLTNAMQKGFKDKYGINVEFLPGRGEELVEKLKAERRAGLYLADLFIGGSTIPLILIKPYGLLDKFEPLVMLPEVKDPKMWFGEQLIWLDKDRTTLAFTTWPVAPLVLNTSFIKPGEIVSFNDLLNPKLKGKIVIDDPTVSGVGSKVIGFLGSTSMNWDFIRELAKLEPTIQRDARMAIEGTAQGKYAVYIGVKPELVQDFKKAGAPLEFHTPKEGTYLSSGSGAISVFTSPPHPNAAKLFVNWLLTREGQIVFSKAYGVPSARMDVPTEGFDAVVIPKPGMKYVRSDTEEFVSMQPEHMKMSKEIFSVKR